MTQPKNIRIRKWLNAVDSYDNGWIKFTSHIRSAKTNPYMESQLTIADCNRQITLSTACDSKRDWDRLQKKLLILETSLREYRLGLEKHRDWILSTYEAEKK